MLLQAAGEDTMDADGVPAANGKADEAPPAPPAAAAQPEVEVYAYLLVIMFALDRKQYELVRPIHGSSSCNILKAAVARSCHILFTWIGGLTAQAVEWLWPDLGTTHCDW
jgi:hypothetical protein